MKDKRINKIDIKPWILLRNINHVMTLAHDKELAEIGLTNRQMIALGMIKRLGGNAKPADISRWLSRKPSTVSAMLIRMGKKGLIKRVHDSENKNQLSISLTKKGEQEYAAAKNGEVIKRILSVLSDTRLNRLTDDLIKLHDKTLSELGYNPQKRVRPWD